MNATVCKHCHTVIKKLKHGEGTKYAVCNACAKKYPPKTKETK